MEDVVHEYILLARVHGTYLVRSEGSLELMQDVDRRLEILTNSVANNFLSVSDMTRKVDPLVAEMVSMEDRLENQEPLHSSTGDVGTVAKVSVGRKHRKMYAKVMGARMPNIGIESGGTSIGCTIMYLVFTEILKCIAECCIPMVRFKKMFYMMMFTVKQTARKFVYTTGIGP